MKVVAIMGGSRGIGKAMAEYFKSKKWEVAICSRTKEELDSTQKELDCYAEFCDVRFPFYVKRFLDQVLKNFGSIDLLINCSGILGPKGPLEENDLTEWKDAIDTNLLGTVYGTHYAIPIMKKQGYGKIINMCGGGIGGRNIDKGFSAYSTSKFGVAGFTELIADELSFFNIKINAISPGAVDTKMAKERWVRGSTPDKAVELAWFLANTVLNISGKVISAKWDDYRNFKERDSLYNLRRVT